MSNNNIGFMVRFVNWEDVYNRYFNGEFSQSGILSSSAVNINSISLKKMNLGTDEKEDRYIVQTRDGTEITLHTTNCRIYKEEEKGTFRCGWCGTDLPFSRKGNTPVILRIVENSSVLNVGGIAKNITEIEIYGDRFCCDFSCALSKATRDHPPEVSDYIRFIHRIMYPKVPKLERAPEPEYLDINDGTLSYQEFKSKGNDCYIPTVGITLKICKRSIAEIV